MGQISISLITSILILNSCCYPKKYYTTEFGSERPKRNKFSFSKRIEKFTNSYFEEDRIYIHVDSVYGKDPTTGVNKLSIYKTFERYFKTGQYLQGTIKNFNTALKDYNNLRSGIAGYYRIENNKIRYEYFLVTAQNCGAYYKGESALIGDSIVGYKKMQVGGLTGTPDW